MNKKIVYILAAIVLLAGGYLFLNTSSNSVIEDSSEEVMEHDVSDGKEGEGQPVKIPDNETVELLAREIKITAKKYEFDKKEIKVKKGEKIKLVIENNDVTHGIIIPDLVDPSTQNNFNEIELTLNEIGEFYFYCATPCGYGHGQMTGKIIVS